MSTTKSFEKYGMSETVEVTRLTGSGPRRSGDRYHFVASNGRSLTAEYVGRRGGHDVWNVEGHGGEVSGDLAFYTVGNGDSKADKVRLANHCRVGGF